jgi:hypothetical protein
VRRERIAEIKEHEAALEQVRAHAPALMDLACRPVYIR